MPEAGGESSAFRKAQDYFARRGGRETKSIVTD
jgi:hypothetical protein